MQLLPEVTALLPELKAWRHHLHAHPETAFEETATSAFVADKLRSFGLEVHTGLARTGVVGVLRGRSGGDAIGLRADLDALHIHEQSGVTHASTIAGKMHACGHDGHTAMLLGAASVLARKPDFSGTVYFIFQPAEENEGGGRVMVEEGLFERFPMRAVYGMHNWPLLPLGTIATRAGPFMGAFDIFEIVATGKGAHAAMPNTGKDPMLFVAHAIGALQTIVARNLHPLEAGVVSVTQVHGGDTWNVIPQEVVLRGTVRSFDPAVQDLIEQRMRAIVAGAAAMFEMTATRPLRASLSGHRQRRHGDEARARRRDRRGRRRQRRQRSDAEHGQRGFRVHAAGEAGVLRLAGAGRGPETPNVHNPHYDFNDDALPIGASYWVTLARQQLPPS